MDKVHICKGLSTHKAPVGSAGGAGGGGVTGVNLQTQAGAVGI
jgi:hypothetical protein